MFEKIENPQLIRIPVGFSLSEKRDTLLTLSNYTKYMEYTSFSNLEQYNKIIETAISRQIDLDLIYSFVFIHEIPTLNETKFIRSILFPWNKNFEAESMISIWNEFWETKKFDFIEVVLIWDGMGLDEFMKVFLAVSKTNTILRIHINKNNREFNKLFDRLWLNQLRTVKIILWDNDEFILWESFRQNNEINLRKWYYQSSWSPQNIFELSNWCIKYQDGFKKNVANKFSIEFDKVQSLSFHCLPVALTIHELKKNSDQVNFDNNSFQIDMSTIKNACYEMINGDQISFLSESIKMSNKFNIQVKYANKHNFIDLEITNMPLEKDDVSNLINKISWFGNIKKLSLLINEPSSAIDILDWWKHIYSISWITLEVRKGFNLIQNHKLRLIAKELKCQGKRGWIFVPNKLFKNI